MPPVTQSLNWMNFFLADVRDGLGPFLGVFLQANGWNPEQIGYVMALGGIAGMVATTPMGMLIDAVRAKRAIIMLAAVTVIAACSINYFFPYPALTGVAQMLTAIAGAAIPPAIAGITLGVVGPAGFDHQLGRNEAFNHGGNAFAAAAAGLFSYHYGLGAVFVLMGVMALGSVICVLCIRPQSIDHTVARGAVRQQQSTRLLEVLRNHYLLTLAVTVTLFHLGNAAMLPLLSQAMVARDSTVDPGAYTAATVIVAQVTMIPMALVAAWFGRSRGYWGILLLALMVLPIRGALAAVFQTPWILLPVQVLDGIGAGLMGVAVPGLVARILRGTGHFNAGLAALMTLQGVGAAMSPGIAGVIAHHGNYAQAFLALAVIACLALLLWLLAARWMRPICLSRL